MLIDRQDADRAVGAIALLSRRRAPLRGVVAHATARLKSVLPAAPAAGATTIRMRPGVALGLMSIALAACAARPAPGISGRWTPVNRFPEQTHAIPLRAAYQFHATPLDRTLRTLLGRWARDMKMTLVYEHGSDFTLHAPVASLRTDDLHTAAASLGELYAAEQVAISIEADRIIVRHASGRSATP